MFGTVSFLKQNYTICMLKFVMHMSLGRKVRQYKKKLDFLVYSMTSPICLLVFSLYSVCWICEKREKSYFFLMNTKFDAPSDRELYSSFQNIWAATTTTTIMAASSTSTTTSTVFPSSTTTSTTSGTQNLIFEMKNRKHLQLFRK